MKGKNALAFYSDASSIPEGAGVGVATIGYDLSTTQRFYSQKKNIGKKQIIYNGELEGITQGLEYASRIAEQGQQMFFLSDSQAAILRLKTQSSNPGQACRLPTEMHCCSSENQRKRSYIYD